MHFVDLELRQSGFLNSHSPFCANVISMSIFFHSVLVVVLFFVQLLAFTSSDISNSTFPQNFCVICVYYEYDFWFGFYRQGIPREDMVVAVVWAAMGNTVCL